MFTGIVTAIGTVKRVTAANGGVALTISAPYPRLRLGESISVSGACLTVASKGPGWFGVEAVATTLQRTRFAGVKAGDRLNLERALRAGDPLGGHLVQGHVEGVGEVVAVAESGAARLLDIRVPAELNALLIPLGSITVEGVSLTVNARPAPDIIQVALVPYTREHTTLGEVSKGASVHLEVDMIAKYVRQFLKQE